ncbi:MAG: hypothetical protein JWM95_1627 [Gemmatimonadetes bacterium]|nr:hypothetical protein [Gemmatimonadota bacterium]
MKEKNLLAITSVLSILLLTLHLTDDIVRGWFPRGIPDLVCVLATTLLLYGALVIAERPLGYLIMIVTGLTGAAMPVLHMKELGGEFAKGNGAFFFIWTVLAVGATGCLTVILAMRGMWSLRQGRRRESIAR